MNNLRLKHLLVPSLTALACCLSPMRAEDRPAERPENRPDPATQHETQEKSSKSSATAMGHRLGTTLKADQLIGMEVRNNQREDIGEVDNLIVDLTNGRVIAVIVSSGGFMGLGDTLSAVPPQSLRMNTERNRLLLDVNKETLADYPHFKSNEWTQLDDPNYLAQIYQAYHVAPYWKTTEAAGGTDSPGATATIQGAGENEAKVIGRIRQIIAEKANLSTEDRNIRVTLEQGKIKVQGTVSSEAVRNRIMKSASQAAPAAEFNFDLQVK